MPDLGQAQTGHGVKALRSTPKQLKLTASDKTAAMFKCMGNNHYVPMLWAGTATVASGTTAVVLASGVKFYDMDLATYATVIATAKSDPGGDFWVAHDTGANTITLTIGTTAADAIDFNVQYMLGPGIDISTLSTRGTGAPAQSYP
jgi:hypothetical protein